jgi:acyl-coenzyme A thioesterase PaaI-like protein
VTTLGDRLASRLGLVLEAGRDGVGVVALEPGDHLLSHGVVRMAAWVLMVDIAGGLVADSEAGEDWVFTTDLSVRVPALRVPERVVATPRMLRLGRSSISAEVRAVEPNGAPFAYGQASFVRLARREGDNPKPSALELPRQTPLGAPLVEEAGIRVLDPSRGRVEVDLADALRNPAGAMQGAMVALVGEVAAEERASHEAGARQVVTDLDVRYLAMGQRGPITATAETVAPTPGAPLRVELRDQGKDDRVMAVMLARTAPAPG